MEGKTEEATHLVEGERRTAHIPFLDHVRGVAIFMVFAYHCVGVAFQGTYTLGWDGMVRDFRADPALLALVPAMFGWFGVSVFFALSGFCIHLSHARSRSASWQGFFVRRWFRIYPPYLLALLLFSFCPPWAWVTHLADLKHFAAHAVLLHNLADSTHYSINPSFWSVAVEFQLYLLYPLMLLLARKAGWKNALWLLAAVELGLRAANGVWEIQTGHFLPKLVSGSAFYYAFSWALGAAAADSFLRGERSGLLRWPLWLWPVLAAVCFVFRPLDVFNSTIFSVATVHVILWLMERPGAGAAGALRWLSRHFARAGILSYSVYLLNQPLLEMVGPAVRGIAGEDVHPLVVFAVCMLAWFPMLAIATPVFRLAEQPAIVWGKAAAAWLGKREKAGKPDLR